MDASKRGKQRLPAVMTTPFLSCISRMRVEQDMSVRVLDDEPGYALLVFDKPTDSPSLKLSIKSLQVGQGCYLDPSGAWLKAPHFFSGQRVQAPDGRFGYRVGPELVNHMLDQDWIEVSSEDGTFCEQGVWENASPLMNPRGIFVQPTSPLPLISPPPPPPPPPPGCCISFPSSLTCFHAVQTHWESKVPPLAPGGGAAHSTPCTACRSGSRP